MALSMIVSMFDLAHTCMEPMETAIGEINASGLTHWPRGGYISNGKNGAPAIDGVTSAWRYLPRGLSHHVRGRKMPHADVENNGHR